MGHGYCSAPRRAVRPRELPLICTYARLVLPLCLHERISLQTGIGRSKIQTITIGSLTDRQHVSPLANISPLCTLRVISSFVTIIEKKKKIKKNNNLCEIRESSYVARLRIRQKGKKLLYCVCTKARYETRIKKGERGS